MTITPLGRAALQLARKGLRIFPCKERGKEPAFKDWPNIATTDETKIQTWWRYINWNIGIATGRDSGVWVVDVDGIEGERTLRQLEQEHGALPPSVEVITGKGRHLYFRWPTGETIRNSQLRFDLPGLEWRGEGGYVLAPPSIHPSGVPYAWSVDSADEFANAPDWLLDIVAKRKARAPIATPPEVWRTFIEDVHEGSHRRLAIARLYGHWVRHYIDPYEALSVCQLFNELRCVPPLDRDEVREIADAIAEREAARREREED